MIRLCEILIKFSILLFVLDSDSNITHAHAFLIALTFTLLKSNSCCINANDLLVIEFDNSIAILEYSSVGCCYILLFIGSQF